jgi:predicted permease
MVLEDIRYALRQFWKSPVFTLTAIATLALGIGANTAIFSVVNAVLRHPAGVDHPERIAVMYVRYTQFGLDVPVISMPDFTDTLALKDQVETGALMNPASFNILHDGVAEHLIGASVSSQWFRVFGAAPILGRTFTKEEDQPNAGRVAVLSYGLWQSAFGRARDVVGKTVLLDQKPYQVIGVMRSDFDWPRGNQVWVPIALEPKAFAPENRFNEGTTAIVRLRPGVTVEQLNAGLAQKMREEIRREGAHAFGASAGWSFYASRLAEFAAGPLRKPLYVLFGVVALVLLIASANVAGLFLARASARSREFAIRTALGAHAGRMLQQLFVETLILAGTAAALGIAAGPLLGRLLLLMVPQGLAEGFSVHMEPSVLGFTVGITLLTSFIAGVGPALKMLRRRDHIQLHEGGRSATASVEKQRLRSTFVITEVALAFLLLAGTGLFLASLRELQRVSPGFNPQGVLSGQVFYSGDDFNHNQQRQAAFLRGVLENLSAQPGVRAAAAVDPLPFDPVQGGSSSFSIEGQPTAPNDPGPHSAIGLATPDYLRVMQIRLIAGRWFSDEDRADTLPVAVIDARLAHRYWPNENPIGKYISSGGAAKKAEIVGIVATIHSHSLESETTDGMRYYAYAQVSDGRTNFLVRGDGDPSQYAAAIERAVKLTDGTQTTTAFAPLETLVASSLAPHRLIVWMLGAFAGLALLLAVVGIYGLISYVTTQRTGEVGVRMALGAQRSSVVWLVLRGVFTWIVAGLGIGIVLSVAATILLRHMFADFGTGEISSLGVAVLTLLAIGTLAGLLPAFRAASVNPVQALRNE